MTDNAFPYSYDYIAEALESAYEDHLESIDRKILPLGIFKRFTVNFLTALEEYDLIGQNKTVFQPGYITDIDERAAAANASNTPCIIWEMFDTEGMNTLVLSLSFNNVMITGEVTVRKSDQAYLAMPDADSTAVQVNVFEDLTEDKECGKKCAERLVIILSCSRDVFAKLPF